MVDDALETAPDYAARHKFLKTGAELLDAFPSKKIDATISEVLDYGDLDSDTPRASSPEEAREKAND